MPTPRMRSGILACCRLEKRAARHRAPSIDPGLKPLTSETSTAFCLTCCRLPTLESRAFRL
jgi:hypothetical protein